MPVSRSNHPGLGGLCERGMFHVKQSRADPISVERDRCRQQRGQVGSAFWAHLALATLKVNSRDAPARDRRRCLRRGEAGAPRGDTSHGEIGDPIPEGIAGTIGSGPRLRAEDSPEGNLAGAARGSALCDRGASLLFCGGGVGALVPRPLRLGRGPTRPGVCEGASVSSLLWTTKGNDGGVTPWVRGRRLLTMHGARFGQQPECRWVLESRDQRKGDGTALCYLVRTGLAPHMPSLADGGAEGGALREKGAQAADALADGVLRWVAERQAHAVSAAAVGVERGS